MNNYYDVNLKKARLSKLLQNDKFENYEGLIENQELLKKIFNKYNPSIVVHLAAQAGVRHSINYPSSYLESNLIGTFQILEIVKKFDVKHLLIASSSSVYGSSKNFPFNENQKTNQPMSFYAATKKSSEVMAHSYSHLFDIPTTIFRFFTVYGPWGRPDMALFKFTKNILLDKPIDVYNKGNMIRDFTYIADLIRAIFLLMSKVPATPNKRKKLIENDSISDVAPFRIVNIGNSNPTNLIDYIFELEKVLQKKAKKNFLGMQEGDVPITHSNVDLLSALVGYIPNTSLSEGISEFVEWYKSYYS